MEARKEYVRKIENECNNDVRAEYERFFKGISVIALAGAAILIIGAESLNWMLSWSISIGALAVMVLAMYTISFLSTLWRVKELRFRALLRGELGWELEALRGEIRVALKEIARDMSKIDSVESKVEWLRGEIRDDLRHEIEMHEIRTSD
jgi:uncharacterized membrane protein YkgB